MTREDARFEDTASPLKLRATTPEDVAVFSSLLQDAIVQVKDVAWLESTHRMALVSSRYCWEKPNAKQRVKTGLHLDHVVSVQVKGIQQNEAEAVFTLLSVEAEEDTVHFRGTENIDILANVSSIDLMMQDISAPWSVAHAPNHESER